MHRVPMSPVRPSPEHSRKLEVRLHQRDAEELSTIAHRGRVNVEDLAAQVLVDYLHRCRAVRASASTSTGAAA